LAGAAASIACATLIAPTMRSAAKRLSAHSGAALEVVEIENGFFGPEINISGLLTGSDLIRVFGGGPRSAVPVYISSRMLSDRTHTLLDDMTLDAVSDKIGRPVVPALTLSDLARDLKQRSGLKRAA